MEQDTSRIFTFIEENIEKVLKKPVGFIHYPFIDPGSVYDGNVWDWDTYWSVYGLLPLLDRFQDAGLKARVIEHAKGNVLNFLDWQLPDGYIPMMIENGEWPEPYLNIQHKNGYLMNMHKPFLCQQIALISGYIHDFGWIADDPGKMEQIGRYFDCYDANYYDDNCGLYVWRDDIMIGMDNDPASFGRPKSSTANIYLNSFMTAELEAAAQLYAAAGDTKNAARMRDKRAQLITAIHEEMFDQRDGFYYSVDVDIKTRPYDWFHKGLGVFWKTLPIRIQTWMGFLPMLHGYATKEEAQKLVQHFHEEAAFGSEFGIPTLDKREKMFSLAVTNNPSNWLGPIWLVANYCVFRAMKNYGYEAEAKDMFARSFRLLDSDLQKTGSLHEYYNPFTGVPVMNGGFINWNILVLNMESELETK